MCFFSFGALCEWKYTRYRQIRKKFMKKRKRKSSGRKSKKSRKSLDETPDTITTNGNNGNMTANKPQRKAIKSFAGSNVENEYTDFYGNDGRTVSRDKKVSILAQS